jgi:hypothetical protein
MNITPEQAGKMDPNNPIFVVMEKLQLIEQKMKAQDPLISTHLKEIWKHMQQYEELAHLLNDEEIGVLFRGLSKHTGITLVAEDSGKRKKAPKVGVDDLI